ncbi:hypothetical protein Patl1_17808 [Pistacia atlantica]|uniref:Uncharacterized protein n=1 Tax=Pistacia atlantica TaxID=434234 RepID=A0ACC1C2E3_9ROSI|nr:hypothetical protein Patl1_17808 [Pistacia atlantica]
MANFQQSILIGRDVDQAIRVLKKGTYLLKYGRYGKPKFCPFKLSTQLRYLKILATSMTWQRTLSNGKLFPSTSNCKD